ncbi:uncharacterized protein LOC144119880 [Amblyomma americanum]
MLCRRAFRTKAGFVGVVLYAVIMFVYFCHDSATFLGQKSPVTNSSSSAGANLWLQRHTTDVKPIERFYYGSTTGVPELPAIYVAFVVPGCRSRSAAVVYFHGFGGTLTQLGDALDSLLKHASRPLHVDVLVARRSKREALAMLLDNLTPRMRAGAGAVVDLLRLEPLIRRLAASNASSSIKSSTGARENSAWPKRRWLFCVCTELHRLFRVDRLLLLAPEVQFHADVALLWEQFQQFPTGAVFGLAREQSAKYAWALSHRGVSSKGTGGRDSCGKPPTSGGTPGLNGAVALLDLDAMRRSAAYQRLSSAKGVDRLAREYGWRGGSLADGDFYTMAVCQEPDLLHMLPCSWNRQVPARNRAPFPLARAAVSSRADHLGEGLYTWCEGGTYACSAHCPED